MLDVTPFSIPGVVEATLVHEPKNHTDGIHFKKISDGTLDTLWFDVQAFNDDFWKNNLKAILSLAYNNVGFGSKPFESQTDLQAYIDSHTPNYTPEEKLLNALEFIDGNMEYDGDSIDLIYETDIEEPQVWRRYYFQNHLEFAYYIHSLIELGYINGSGSSSGIHGIQITVRGLAELVNIKKQRESSFCFVAMSFDKTLAPIYDEAILPAIKATGFNAFMLRDRHVQSDQTINDEIISGLKQSRFTIADFTQHKAGVYFEAGFALGRGQKVIYTCRKDEIDKAHFDTRNFQHIVWETTEELRTKLIDKINAFIID